MAATLAAIDVWTWAAFLGATVVLMLTPGPGMMFCVACGLAGGPRAGIAAGFGAFAGLLVHTALASAGISALAMGAPGAFDVLRWLGAAYLGWLAWTSWTAGADLERRLGRRQVARAFSRGVVTNLTNPKVILFMVAFLPQFARPEIGPVWQQLAIFGTGVALVGLAFDCAYGGLAGILSGRLRRATRLMNRISAVVFGALAARLAIA